MDKKVTLERGKPLSEAKEMLEMVRGSYEYLLRMIEKAFFARFGYEATSRDYFIIETFQEYLIVKEWGVNMPPDEYYQVAYQYDAAGDFTFSPTEEWATVLLAYQVPNFEERRKALTSDKGQRLTEVIGEAVRIQEAAAGKPRKVKAVGAYADQINANGRRYPLAVLREAVADARKYLNESLSQGRAVLLGEAEHPTDKGQRPRFLETIVAWRDIGLDERTGQVYLEGQMVESSTGKDAIAIMEAGVLPGISLRGYGESKTVKEGGRQVEEVQWLKLTGFDMVLEPSFQEAGISKLESKQRSRTMDEKEKEQEEGKKAPGAAAMPSAEVIYENHPEVVKKIQLLAEARSRAEKEAEDKERQAELNKLKEMKAGEEKALREALGVDEFADLAAVIAEREQSRQQLEAGARQREIAEWVEAQCDPRKLGYTPEVATNLKESVLSRKPKTMEEAKAAYGELRAITDKTMSAVQLALKGKYGITVGSVIENELGIPEFAKPAYDISESLLVRNLVNPRQRNKVPTAPAEFFLQEALRLFDKRNKGKLIQEARAYNEAESLSDLDLPYSVSRAIMQEAYPLLISPNVFDWGVAEGSPINIGYESQYAADGASTSGIAVTNEVVNVAALDTWVNLVHKRIRFTGLNLTNTADNVTYVLGTDYTIDPEEGRIMLLSSGSMVISTNYHLDYAYDAFRKGENAAIAKAKAQLLWTTLSQYADRLATEISREAVVFSRTQAGWDAPTQTIALLIKEIAKTIDANLLVKGLGETFKVAGNNAGNWVSATDTLTQLIEVMNAAKTKVQNRNYQPTAIVISTTTANRLVLYDKFTNAGGTPGFILNDQEGFLGQVLGLPVFHSTQFPDSFGLVLNRQLVMHRIFQAMLLRGPYATYDTDGNLKANDQWFVEEFNGSISPIAEKGSYFTIS